MAGVRKTKLKRRRWLTAELPGHLPVKVGYFDPDNGKLSLFQTKDCPVKVKFVGGEEGKA